MTEKYEKVNSASGQSKEKTIIAVALVLLVLIGIVSGGLIARNNIIFKVALNLTVDNNFSEAEEYASRINTRKAKYLCEYIDLRQDINKHYPELLSDFDEELLSEWLVTAKGLYEQRDYFGVKIATDIYNLQMRLDGILQTVEFYEKLDPEITSVFEIFNEVNRLYSKGEDGLYTPFTIAGEMTKIDRWDDQIEAISDFANRMYNGESAYLLNYFIKEAEAESAELRETMESFLEQGYSETDQVRATGTGTKLFPDVFNSDGEAVNLHEPERYRQFMYEGICTVLIEALGEFYLI